MKLFTKWTGKWGRRGPVAALTAGCVVVAAVAVGGSADVPALEFLNPGHWVVNTAAGKVYHVDGATKQVDAEVPLPGAKPGSVVVQGDTSGYVVGAGQYTEFGKSTLRVEATTPAPAADEVPVPLETAGGPYLVYRDAAVVVRLGSEHAVIDVGGELGNPVATEDGTVWLHRVDTGALCKLARGTTVPSCPASAPAGHKGGLTVVGGKPVFVDTTADTMRAVEGNGPERPLGTDVPEETRVAAADVDGRVSILDPAGTLYLVDSAPVVGDRPAAKNVVVDLEEGQYTGPETTGSTIAVLDHGSGRLVTYDSAGTRRQVTPVPPESGKPRLTKADDERVYVEGGEGKHVLVVDPGGAVTEVPVERKPQPTTTTTTPPPPAPTTTTEQVTRQNPPVIAAGPPGAPSGVTATPGSGSAVVTWGPAADNGAPVTAYHVTWNGGGLTVPGSQRSATVNGLADGTAYTFTVVAENRVGRGPGASAQATPRRVPTITVTRGKDTTTDSCRAPDCAFIHIEMRGFAPNTSYEIIPYASEWGRVNPGVTLTTDAEGTQIVDDRFPFSGDGQTVWVVAGGVESNRYYWEKQ
ncbi:fibronectin type III domain-containing protein [Saccharothrix sp.]|uniref:fibronectin type III domain-containing protein n=1 Tax=Saccharothrix sp. TaxID=1873460 RepID=UPI002811D8F1|nr:fibronectin type III domain-containing protein [Saccharothrix sp.]